VIATKKSAATADDKVALFCRAVFEQGDHPFSICGELLQPLPPNLGMADLSFLRLPVNSCGQLINPLFGLNFSGLLSVL